VFGRERAHRNADCRRRNACVFVALPWIQPYLLPRNDLHRTGHCHGLHVGVQIGAAQPAEERRAIHLGLAMASGSSNSVPWRHVLHCPQNPARTEAMLALRCLFSPLCGVSSYLHGTQQEHLRGIKPSSGRVVHCNDTGNRLIGLGFRRLDEDHRSIVGLELHTVLGLKPRFRHAVLLPYLLARYEVVLLLHLLCRVVPHRV